MTSDKETPELLLVRRAYCLFNERRIDALLALMTEDVEWPNVAGGTVLHGREAIRPYWEAQFAAADPRVDPTEFRQVGDDLVAVVEQRVLDRQGRLLAADVVYHRYTFTLGRVSRMVVFTSPEEAFASG